MNRIKIRAMFSIVLSIILLFTMAFPAFGSVTVDLSIDGGSTFRAGDPGRTITAAVYDSVYGAVYEGITWELKGNGYLENVYDSSWNKLDYKIKYVPPLSVGNTVTSVVYATYGGTTESLKLTIEPYQGGSSGSNNIQVKVYVTGKNGECLYNGWVTLAEGVSALKTLEQTGLELEMDPFYPVVKGIGGQKFEWGEPWGIMYAVNGVPPMEALENYELSNNDYLEVYWVHLNSDTGEWERIYENSQPEGTIQIRQKTQTFDEELLDALEETGEAKLNLRDKSDGQAFLSPDTIIQLANKNEPLVVENEGVKVEFAVRSLVTEELNRALEEENTSLKIVARKASEAEKQEILSRAAIGESTGLFDIGGRIIELDAHIARTGDSGAVSTEKIEKFNEPVKVTIDLSGVELSDKDIANLTAVRFEEDAGDNIIPVQLGGTYDPDTKTFTFYTDRFSFYGVLKTKDRVRISLEIGKLDTTVDDEVKRIDVPPTIVNNRTMVPLRFVSECLGAGVEWIGETKTVAIELNDKKLRLVIGETGPGLDTPAIIINGRAFVPIRYVSESFNADVTWFPATKTVEIVK